MISDELRDSYLLVAEACRYAAEQGWRPTDGLLVADHHSPTEWSCCALGALALKREAEEDTVCSDFAEALEFVASMPLSMALGDTGGREAAIGVAHIFDSIVDTWDLCVRGIMPPGYRHAYRLRELNHTYESMAKLTPTEVWLLAAKRFEQLAN
tara:strand:+ start:593 stop:1054 length:462 start_codon:yes stop_codon:yes gene_type:complete